MLKLDLQGAKQDLARLEAPFFTWVPAPPAAATASELPPATTGGAEGVAATSLALAKAAWATSLALMIAIREEGEPWL